MNLMHYNAIAFLVTKIFLIFVDHAQIVLVAWYVSQMMIQEHAQLIYVLLGERGQIILLALADAVEVSNQELW